MNIKDYLHLYLGCECMMYIQNMTEEHQITITPFMLTPEAKVVSYKPILRPLSDMTEEEAIKVGEIVIGRYDSVKFKVIKNQSPSGVFRYWKVHKEHRGYGKSLTIDENGEVDVYDQHDDGSHTIYAHQHEVTRYLLSCGFDLFGLIYEGLAINKTKGLT